MFEEEEVALNSEKESDDDIEQVENEDRGKNKRKTSECSVDVKPNLEKVQYNRKFNSPMKKKRKNDYDPQEEARLERLVFGDQKDVIKNLLKNGDDDDSESETHESSSTLVKDNPVIKTNDSDDDTDNNDDEDNVAADKSISGNDERDSGVDDEDLKAQRKPAWVDDDDEGNLPVNKLMSIQGAYRTRGRKPKIERPEKTYNEYLRNKYHQLVGTPKWAELGREKGTESGDDSDDEILRHSNHLAELKQKNLSQGIIELKNLKKINHQTRTEGPIVTNVQFHPTSTVALVAGLTGVLSIFQIDGKENTKLHSMRYERFPINTARFTKDGTEIVVGSQRHAHCHAYDLLAGKTHRIPLPHGMTNMKNFEVSPDGKLIAVCGRFGDIYLLTAKTKELICSFKMNDKSNTLAFSPDSKKLFTHGEGSEIYVWDLNERTCIHRAIDDGCLAGSRIAISPSGQYLATGSKQGVVNVYDTNTVLQKNNPSPLKIILNLVTSITSLKFNPTSEILSMASDEAENAFKMMHFPSATIFSNFPTFSTKLWNPIAVDFSPSSGYLGITNNKGSAYLYRLKHYENY